ncbi:MAG TPA: hypothetical protein VJ853_02300 [Thermoanaerobaculia bacterium]|nr:hypothetical protein [Thermoanaerobaculia bacterium]
MKRALLLLLLIACSKKEQPVPAPGSPIEPVPVGKTAAKSDSPLPGSDAHPVDWSIPPRGVVLWLVGDDAKAEFGGALDAWTNEYLPTAKATADRPEKQPSVIPNAINQHSVIRFDGINNVMDTTVDIGPQRMPDATIFAVFSSRSDSGAGKIYSDDMRGAGLNQGRYSVFAGGKTSSVFKLQMNTVYVTEEQFTKTDVSAWANGKQMLDKVAAAYDTETPPKMSIGKAWYGDIAEIIVYSRLLSDLERMQIEDYLGKKYGVEMPR